MSHAYTRKKFPTGWNMKIFLQILKKYSIDKKDIQIISYFNNREEISFLEVIKRLEGVKQRHSLPTTAF